MKLTDFLAPENIQTGVILSCKKRALEHIGKLVAEFLNRAYTDEHTQFCPVDCFSHLFKREKLGSTGIGHGVAIPHAKLPENPNFHLEKPIAIFLKLEEGIDYEATDNKEVDLIYAMLFPENSCHQYKNYLPHIAKVLSDKNLLKHLRSATTPEEIWQILEYTDNHFQE